MFFTLVSKELRTLLLSKQFIISFSMCAFLIVLSFFVGIQNFKNAQAQYESSTSQHQQKLEQSTHWQTVRQQVFLPPDPLSVLVGGLSNDVGRRIDFQRGRDLIAEDSRFGDNTMLAIFRTLDVEFMLSVVLTLFAIVFTYNSVNGEREQGTLSLLFSNAVPRSTYITAKVFGVISALIIPLLVPLLIGLALLPLFGIQFTSQDWVRITLILLAGLAHFTFFALIGIAISATVRSSTGSFLTLLVIWIASVFIVPRAAVLIAGRAIEVPNVDNIIAQKNRYRIQLFEEDRPKISSFQPSNKSDMQAAMKEFQKMMADFGEARTKKTDEFSRQLEEELTNKQQLRDRVAGLVARLSPTAAFSFTVNDLANAGMRLPTNFLSNAKIYKANFDSFISGKTGSSNSGMVMIMETSEERPKLDFTEMPVFQFERSSLTSVLNQVLIGFGILGFFNGFAFLAALIGFTKSDIR